MVSYLITTVDTPLYHDHRFAAVQGFDDLPHVERPLLPKNSYSPMTV